MSTAEFEITSAPICGEDTTAVSRDPACGAVVTFLGVVRDHNEGRQVKSIYYDCYKQMAEREIGAIVSEAKSQHPVKSVRIVHRVGDVKVGEVSLLVNVESAHRGAAFDAIQQIVDQLKQKVPIWKKEQYADGSESWI